MTATAPNRSRPRLHERLGRHELAFGVVLLTAILAITYVAVISTNGIPFLSTYELRVVLPSGTPAVLAGDQVRVGGRQTGIVRSVIPTRHALQLVTFTVGDGPVGRSGQVIVRPLSDAGGIYLDVERGDYRSAPLRDGGSLPESHAHYTQSVVDVIAGFSRPSLRRSAAMLRWLGAGLDGQGTALNDSLQGLATTLNENATLLQAVAGTHRLAPLVDDAGRVAHVLAGSGDLGGVISGASALTTILGDRHSELGRTINELGPAERATDTTLPELDSALEELRAAAVALRPGVTALRAALPPTVRALADGPSLRRNVAALAGSGEPALRTLTPVLENVGPVAVLLEEALPAIGHLTAFLAPYGHEFEAGSIGYYVADLYRAQVGLAKGYPAAPAMLVLTCASGSDPSPKPGEIFTDKLSKPCA